MVAMRALLIVALSACGRIGFDPFGDVPVADVDLDLTTCSLPVPLTLTRASQGTYFDATRQLRSVPADTPRCAFDPGNGAPLGVLIEGASTNYAAFSRGDGAAVDNLPQGWDSQHDVDVTANGVVIDSPTFVGFREVTITTSNSGAAAEYYQVMLDVDVPSGGDYTLSWFMRSDAPTGIETCTLFASYWTPNFGMELRAEAEITTDLPGPSWNRVSRVLAAPPGTGVIQPFIGCGVLPGTGYQLSLAIPQLEPGRFATSPIMTTGTPATRAAERLTMPAGELVAPDAGTIVVDVALHAVPTDITPRTAVAIGDGTPPVYTIAYAGTDWIATRGGATLSTVGTPSGRHRIGHRYSTAASALSVDATMRNGPAVVPVTGATASFGSALDATDALFGSIARIRAWSTALDDASLLDATE